MRKLLLLTMLSVIFINNGYSYNKYWIQFADKAKTPYSVTNPSAFLSQRSIDRRTKQAITTKERDLPIDPAYINEVLNFPNVRLLNSSKWFNAITIETTDTISLNAIKKLAFVVKVDPVKRFADTRLTAGKFSSETLTAVTTKNAQRQPAKYDYGASLNQIHMIGVDCLHEQGYSGEGKVIAVIDAGFLHADTLSAFDSLRINNQVLGTWDFVAGNESVYEDDPHGAEVLSCMAANIPGQLIGTAPKAKYWLLRSEDAATEFPIEEDNWVAAAEFADSVGADVINTSLGYNLFDDSTMNYTYSQINGRTSRMSLAQNYAAAVGMLSVCAAGNEGAKKWFYITVPADADSVLAVGAVNANGILAGFSSRGPTFDRRIKPNVVAQGQNTVLINPYSGTVISASGTSFASPLTAGAVACLWQANPQAKNMEIFNAIQKSASQFASPDSLLGFGISDFCKAKQVLAVHEKNINTDLFHIYPNPFTDRINISVEKLTVSAATVKIYDITGRVIIDNIKVLSNGNFNISLPFFKSGIYFVQIKSDSYIQTTRLVKL